MQKYKIVVLLIAFALLLGATFLVAAENFGNPVKASEMGEIDYPYPAGDGIVKWVSTEWLEEHLYDEDLMILDVQPGFPDYIKAHIPGAVYMNEGLLRVPLNGRPCVHVPSEAIEPVLQRVGLKADVPVVVYTGKGGFNNSGDGLEQTMMTYSLARFGQDNIYVLDGGFNKWQEEGRELTKVFPEVEESDFEVNCRVSEYAISMEELKEIKDDKGVVLLDARPAKAYEGQAIWIKPGHIPGAVNLPWVRLMDEKNTCLLKSNEEIKDILKEDGVTPDKTIICSCGTSREATAEFTLLKWYLGYPDVRIYEGSFTEWSAYPENPTVTGPNPYHSEDALPEAVPEEPAVPEEETPGFGAVITVAGLLSVAYLVIRRRG